MSTVDFSYEHYEKTRDTLIRTIGEQLTEEDKKFFLSFESGMPDWNQFSIPVLKDLPAIQWKLLNINKLKKVNAKKHEEMVENLKVVMALKD